MKQYGSNKCGVHPEKAVFWTNLERWLLPPEYSGVGWDVIDKNSVLRNWIGPLSRSCSHVACVSCGFYSNISDGRSYSELWVYMFHNTLPASEWNVAYGLFSSIYLQRTRMRRRFGSTLCKIFYFTSKLSEKILDNFWLWIYFFIEIPSSNCFSTDTLQFPSDEVILGWIISNTSVQISNHHSRFPGIRLTLQKTLILNGYRGCIVLLYHGVMILLINNQNQLLDILMWISLEMKEPCSIIDAQHYRFAILVTTSSLSLFLISQHSIGTNNCFSFRSILHCSRVEKSSGLESRVYHEWMVNWIAMQ